jgi:hypothetical protein
MSLRRLEWLLPTAINHVRRGPFTTPMTSRYPARCSSDEGMIPTVPQHIQTRPPPNTPSKLSKPEPHRPASRAPLGRT